MRYLGRTALAGLLAYLLIAGVGPGAPEAADAFYTREQALAGLFIYNSNCAQCHGSKLQGHTAPPLIGPAFAQSLASDKATAEGLYEFIGSHMPAHLPGYLWEPQFLQVFAYLLSANGYPAGSTKLTRQTLGRIELPPSPGTGK